MLKLPYPLEVPKALVRVRMSILLDILLDVGVSRKDGKFSIFGEVQVGSSFLLGFLGTGWLWIMVLFFSGNCKDKGMRDHCPF